MKEMNRGGLWVPDLGLGSQGAISKQVVLRLIAES